MPHISKTPARKSSPVSPPVSQPVIVPVSEPINIDKIVLEIADTIEQQKADLDKLYGNKIIELCKNNPSTKVYDGINSIHTDIFNNIKLTDFPLPTYWYDYNKGKFIPAINMYQGKKFIEINFQIYNSKYIFHKDSTYKTVHEVPPVLHMHCLNMTEIVYGSYTLNPVHNAQLTINRNNNDIHYLNICIDDHLNIFLPEHNIIIIRNYSSFSIGSIDNIFDMHNIRVYNYKNEDDKKLFIEINEFINKIRTITSNDSRNSFTNDLFNKLYNFIEYDTKLNKIKKNITYIDTLISYGNQQAQGELNNIKTTLVKTQEELTQAKEKINTLEDEHIAEIASKEDDLIGINHKLSKTKAELDKYVNIIVPDMSPEQMKCKIQNLEKTIMTLENDLSTYKGEISVYKQYYDTRQKEILQLQENNINLTEIIAKNQIDIIRYTNEITNMKMLKSTITTMTQQIKDMEAIREEENINFNKKIIELNGIISNLELDKMEMTKKLTRITELEIDIEKMKLSKITDDEKMQKLNDMLLKLNTEKQSVISKCVLLNDRIIELETQKASFEETIKKSQYNEDELNKKIMTLENIISEKETEISIMKTNKISSLETVGVKGGYESILYSQIKELENENIKYKQIIAQKENEIKIEKNKYSDFEKKIKSLLQ